MAINKEFYAPRHEIKSNDIVVCDVRGITPNDLAQIMVENAAEVEELFTLLERDDTLKGVAVDDPQAVLTAMQKNSKQFFQLLINKVPVLVAKVIAVAADAPEDWQHVAKNYVLPLQFEAITEIARLTFVDSNGFKAFLGNVLALTGNASADQREVIEHQTDSTGSDS